MTNPSDMSLGVRRASPLTSAAPPAPSLIPYSNAPPSSSSTVTTTTTTSTTNAAGTSILTPSGAAPDGLPTAGAHSSGPHSSQPGGQPLYFSSQMPGSWQGPGGTQLSSYTYANSTQATASSGSLTQPPYSRGAPMYGSSSSPSLQHYGGRAPTSTSNGENLPPPQSYQDQSPYPSPIAPGGSGAGGSSGALGSPLGPQTQGGHQQSGLAPPMLGTPTSTTNRPATSGQNTQGIPGPGQEGNPYRQPPTPTNCYPPSSTPQQGSFPAFPSPGTQASPATTSPATTSGQIPRAMAPPLHFPNSRGHGIPPMASYASYASVSGPVLSNVHHPGTPLSMVGGVPGLGGYPHHPSMQQHHLYVHHTSAPAPHQDRPFKCDQCPQSFNRNHDLKRHKRIHLDVKPFPCGHCDKSFSRKDALKRHKLVKGVRLADLLQPGARRRLAKTEDRLVIASEE
ncbi:Protein krueppel [Madurella mycetomatis]|uniref:Protein krueppel n=1 Tax=Madurella mycetomatis TaxID=100816 RepID=A0A175VRF2_9PEZI|nr:Protein krueppel [Madurella mycetomatis]